MLLYKICVRGIMNCALLACLFLVACAGCVGYAQDVGSAPSKDTLPPLTWHLRVTNPADAKEKVCVRVYFNPERMPYYGDTFYLGLGGEQDKVPPETQWLSPGQSSDWIDISTHIFKFEVGPIRWLPLIYNINNYLSPVLLGVMSSPESSRLRLTVELASGPQRKLIRKLDVSEPNPTAIGYNTWLGSPPMLPTLGLLTPVDPASKQRIWTLEEAAEEQLKWLKPLKPVPPCRYMQFISIQRQVALRNPSRLQKMQTEIVNRLGYGNLTSYATSREDIEAIKAMGIEPRPARIVNVDIESSNNLLSDIEAAWRVEKEAGLLPYVSLVSFGDEPEIKLQSSPAVQDDAFVTYLKQRGFKPIDFVRPEDEAAASSMKEDEQWKYVHLGGPLPAGKPKLLYEAAVFRYVLWSRELSACTKRVKELFPPGTQTGTNFSPTPHVWPDVRKWINLVRDGGMTMPWSEDWWWFANEASPQTYGFLLGSLRHAADYENAPVCFYPIPYVGSSADHFLMMNYLALGHQVKVVHHWFIFHHAYSTGVSMGFLESRDRYRAIHRITSDVAKIDERLYKARMRPSDVAILLSKANDVWNTEDLLTSPDQATASRLQNAQFNVDNHERKAIWLALRHSHIPVDVITDDDVASGLLKKYKVLYLVGQEIQSGAVAPLLQWVNDGGTLISDGGGGLMNEYEEPIREMYGLYGLTSAALSRPMRTIQPAIDLRTLKALDNMTVGVGNPVNVPVLCYKHQLTPAATTSVIATYSDGSAAATEHKVGKGKAVLFGGLIGLSYLQPAIVNWPPVETKAGYPFTIPQVYPSNLRLLISRWAESAGIRKHVVTSDPLVEATLQEGPKGVVITLVNFKNSPVSKLTVSMPGLAHVRRVTSLRHGDLAVKPRGSRDAVPVVSLSVDQGDLLIID